MYVQDPNANPPQLTRPDHLESRRSSIPKVVGILGIIFSAFGIIGSLAMTFGPADALRRFDATSNMLGGFGTWMNVYMVIAALLFGLHLTGAIQSIRYAPSAPRFMTLYGVLALVLLAADIALSIALFPDGRGFMRRALYEEMVYPRLGMAVLALPWPIIALALMNSKSARAACAPHPGR